MKIPSSLLLAVLFSTLVTFGCRDKQDQHLPTDVDDRIELIENNLYAEGRKWTIEERLESLKIPGLSIAVIHDFKLDWAKGYGYADIAEKRKVTRETLFQAASISKSLTGVAVMKLAEEGKVRLSDDINVYLTSWKFPYDERSGNKKITLYNLLSHTAGTTVHGFRGYKNGTNTPTVVQILNGESPANNEPVRSDIAPGTKVQYSGGGTTIVQLLISDVSGKPFSEFMASEILQPLGMTSSFYHRPDQTKKEMLATGYLYDKSEIPGKFKIHPEEGAASLWTNPTDLAKYIIDTQLALKNSSSKILSRENTLLRLTPYKDEAALGVFINTIGSAKYFQHGGANEGFRAVYVADFEKGNGVAIMVNSENNKILNELLLTVANAYRWDGYADSGVKLSDEQLESFEGYYQAAFNSDLYLEFRVKDNKLMLRQLWDGMEVFFEAQSELEFLNKEMSFPLKFSRNTKGQVAEVLAFNKDVWKRDDTFSPKVRKPVALSAEQLQAFAGKFQLTRDKNIEAQIVARDGELNIRQLWDGKEMVFVPENEFDFFQKDNPYRTIRFIKGNNGRIDELVAFGREVLKRVE